MYDLTAVRMRPSSALTGNQTQPSVVKKQIPLPEGALADLGELFVLRKLVAKRKLDAIVIFGHDGGLSVRPGTTQTIKKGNVRLFKVSFISQNKAD